MGAGKPCHVKVLEETGAVFPLPVLVTSAAVMKHCEPQTTEMYCLKVLEVQSPISRCEQGHTHSEGAGEDLFQASL